MVLSGLEIYILTALLILIILVLILLVRNRSTNLPAKLDSSIKSQFLTFQTDIHKELGMAREAVANSNNLISEHTIKTIDTIRNMGTTMQELIQQQEEARKLGQSLKDLLQAPKLRGNYGEVILEEMLDRVLPKGIWERQYLIDGREQVDAIVKIKDIIIPIDAKFPRDDYLKYLEAQTKEEKAMHWKNYENAVKIQIKSIKNKYVKPEKGTSDFALMFIPSEAIYYETIAQKNYLGQPSTIYEYAQENKVIPVSPNTFYAFLQVVVIGIHNLEVVKGAKQLQDRLASLSKSFEQFYKKYEEIGKQIDKALSSYRIGSNHIERYKRQLDSTLGLEKPEEDVDLSEENSIDE